MPLRAWPVADWKRQFSYKDAPRCFGAKRSGGRLHAGCDLYAPEGAKVFCIAPGTVLATLDFYQGTREVQVEHPGIGIVRYGELSVAQGIQKGVAVTAGTVLGYVKKMPKIAHTMLHIELFENTDPLCIGKLLTPSGKDKTIEVSGPFIRRADLEDITPLLDSLLLYVGCMKP